jgi:hypothetical protein
MRGDDYLLAVRRRRRTVAAASFGGVADPFFSSVAFLLHMDGADASTSFLDSGPATRTFTAAGDAQIDTAQSMFGGASGLLDGTGDYVTTASVAGIVFGSGPFRLESFFNRAGGDGARRTICGETGTSYVADQSSIALELSAANVVKALISQSGAFTTVTGTTAFTTAGWHHAAIMRTGDILRLFVDGVQEGGDVAFTGSVRNPVGGGGSPAWGVGRPGSFNGLYWNGWLDEMRLTIGADRGNVTVPTLAFPNR